MCLYTYVCTTIIIIIEKEAINLEVDIGRARSRKGKKGKWKGHNYVLIKNLKTNERAARNLQTDSRHKYKGPYTRAPYMVLTY